MADDSPQERKTPPRISSQVRRPPEVTATEEEYDLITVFSKPQVEQKNTKE